MNNYDPWHMLENVSEKELQEFCNKQASKSGQHHQRPLREGFVFYPTSRLLSTYLDVFSFEP